MQQSDSLINGSPRIWSRLRPAAKLVTTYVILLHPPLPLVGASIVMERERQQNDSFSSTASEACHGVPEADDLRHSRRVSAPFNITSFRRLFKSRYASAAARVRPHGTCSGRHLAVGGACHLVAPRVNVAGVSIGVHRGVIKMTVSPTAICAGLNQMMDPPAPPQP